MKYLTLIWAGLWRKRTRTILTMLSIVVAFLMFGLLQGINRGMTRVYDDIDADRLYTLSVIDSDGLPISYLERIRAVDGVAAVTHWTFFSGYYKDPRNTLTAFATDPRSLFDVFSKFSIPPEQLQAMLTTRDGAIISKAIAAKYGWKVGDRVPLGTTIWTQKDGSDSYSFQIVGIFDTSAYKSMTNFFGFFLNYSYLDEARAFKNGMVNIFVTKVADASRASDLAARIDSLFANSDSESVTQSEQALGQSELKKAGNISAIVNGVVGAVLFALLFLTANTMMQSVRERLPELAVLRALGYTRQEVVGLVIGEAIVLCVVAALLGLLFGRTAFSGLSALFGNVPLPPIVILQGLGVAMLVAMASGLPPALQARRMSVVDALVGR